MSSPLAKLLERIDDVLDQNESRYDVHLDLDRACHIALVDKNPNGLLPSVDVEITGFLPRAKVNGEQEIQLTLLDRLDLAVFRWSLRRRYRRGNRIALSQLIPDVTV